MRTNIGEWRVDHPGIGVLWYETEAAARRAAGTAGVVYAPGDGPPAALSGEAGVVPDLSPHEERRLHELVLARVPIVLFGQPYFPKDERRPHVDRAREVALAQATQWAETVGYATEVCEIAHTFETYLLGGKEAVDALDNAAAPATVDDPRRAGPS